MSAQTTRFPLIRPLYWLSRFLDRIAFFGVHRPSYLPHGSFRERVQYVGIALGWMARGNQWDTRSFSKRMHAGDWFWRAALTKVQS